MRHMRKRCERCWRKVAQAENGGPGVGKWRAAACVPPVFPWPQRLKPVVGIEKPCLPHGQSARMGPLRQSGGVDDSVWRFSGLTSIASSACKCCATFGRHQRAKRYLLARHVAGIMRSVLRVASACKQPWSTSDLYVADSCSGITVHPSRASLAHPSAKRNVHPKRAFPKPAGGLSTLRTRLSVQHEECEAQ
jgi:hypothetical protein